MGNKSHLGKIRNTKREWPAAAAGYLQAGLRTKAQVQVANTRKGPAVAGNGNQVPITTEEKSWLQTLLPYAAGALGLGLILFFWLAILALLRSRV